MRNKKEDFDEVEHLRNLILLIRYRLQQLSAHRMFLPTYEVDYVREMIERDLERWPDDE